MRISVIYRTFMRFGLNLHNRSRLTNKNFSIICNNCVGGILYHELGLKFMSPTINLFIEAGEYISFLKKMEYYLNYEFAKLPFKHKVILQAGVIQMSNVPFIFQCQSRRTRLWIYVNLRACLLENGG